MPCRGCALTACSLSQPHASRCLLDSITPHILHPKRPQKRQRDHCSYRDRECKDCLDSRPDYEHPRQPCSRSAAPTPAPPHGPQWPPPSTRGRHDPAFGRRFFSSTAPGREPPGPHPGHPAKPTLLSRVAECTAEADVDLGSVSFCALTLFVGLMWSPRFGAACVCITCASPCAHIQAKPSPTPVPHHQQLIVVQLLAAFSPVLTQLLAAFCPVSIRRQWSSVSIPPVAQGDVLSWICLPDWVLVGGRLWSPGSDLQRKLRRTA